jgi:glutamate-ammonia-ligase adenylyltransferase
MIKSSAKPPDENEGLSQRLVSAPKLSNPKEARARYAELVAEARGNRALSQSLSPPAVRALLRGVADHSPYLWGLARIDLPRLSRILDDAPEARLEACIEEAKAVCDNALDDDAAMHALRRAKQETALLVALADIGGLWDVPRVTRALADFADGVTQAALSYLLRRFADAGKLVFDQQGDPQSACGLVVLAMGKHGARELNYSSDIDLIVFYDPDTPALAEGVEPGPLFVQITRRLARLLQEHTADGYVLRVDLRLRPDPGSTSVAISLPAAAGYYETVGQNWERAALIKARPVAGQTALGESFLAELAPFIWRKYFDYAAIADIHAMKRQIHSVRGHEEVAIAGHDVKLGRGGIREIEFFVQTQQLIFGGRRPHLRGARTLDMLAALERDGWVTRDAVDELSAAYVYLRMVEHRLQMISDQQTQRLPSEPDALAGFAHFCGHPSFEDFSSELTRHLRNVEKHYARLFENAPGLDAPTGNLVFTGAGDDPDTLETLRAMGFTQPEVAAETVRGWHFGRRNAVQSARAREVLTELVPMLLQSFGGSGDPDAALAAFDAALNRMPAAIELMAILKSNAPVRDLFSDILGSAPRLAHVVAQRPHVLDAAIDPSVAQARNDEASYKARLDALLAGARTFEDFLDICREVAQEERFLIGVRTLSGAIDASEAGRAYSALASIMAQAALERVSAIFAQEYGTMAGGQCVVLGFGKLGSREMTAASDLDLILIYDFDETRPESNGPRRLHGTQYYARLTQRLISALTVATRRGQLYDVDMRLRPSGKKGPVATRLDSFRSYQRDEAETWEHMALTRARVVAGDRELAVLMMDEIRAILALPREPERLRADVHDMRMLIAREKGEDDPFDLKLVSGGIIDIEFIAQYCALRWAAQFPDMLDPATEALIVKAGRHGAIEQGACDTLRAAHRLYGEFTQIVRMAVEGDFDPAELSPSALRRIASSMGSPDFRHLEASLAEMRAAVRDIFNRMLGPT